MFIISSAPWTRWASAKVRAFSVSASSWLCSAMTPAPQQAARSSSTSSMSSSGATRAIEPCSSGVKPRLTQPGQYATFTCSGSSPPAAARRRSTRARTVRRGEANLRPALARLRARTCRVTASCECLMGGWGMGRRGVTANGRAAWRRKQEHRAMQGAANPTTSRELPRRGLASRPVVQRPIAPVLQCPSITWWRRWQAQASGH